MSLSYDGAVLSGTIDEWGIVSGSTVDLEILSEVVTQYVHIELPTQLAGLFGAEMTMRIKCAC